MLGCCAAPFVGSPNPSPAWDSGSDWRRVGDQNLGAIGKHHFGLIGSDLLNDHGRVGLVDLFSMNQIPQKVNPPTHKHC